MGSAKIALVSLFTKTSSHPNVLCPPTDGRFSSTAVSNSSSRSNSCRSMAICSSSPARVFRTRCKTNEPTSVHRQVTDHCGKVRSPLFGFEPRQRYPSEEPNMDRRTDFKQVQYPKNRWLSGGNAQGQLLGQPPLPTLAPSWGWLLLKPTGGGESLSRGGIQWSHSGFPA